MTGEALVAITTGGAAAVFAVWILVSGRRSRRRVRELLGDDRR